MLPIRSLSSSSLRSLPRLFSSLPCRSFSSFGSPIEAMSLLAPAKAGEPKANKDLVATLTLPDGKQIKLPYLKGTQGPDAIDIRKLYDQGKIFTYDPGFTSTASCHSDITYIDGDAGILQYRGYDIAELAEKCDFDEVSYLIMYGELPTAEQKKIHHAALNNHKMVPEQLINFFKGYKSDAHPMAMLTGVVGGLSAFYHDSFDISSAANRQLSAYRLIAKMPTIAAIAYKHSIGQPIVYPRDDLSYAENFLYMMQAIPTRKFHLNPIVVKALETFLILHLDHEQNASTSTVRIAGSSLANPFAALASGISSLWGPSHGGANEAVIKMLEQIGSKDRIPEFIKRAKDKNDSFRLMGFGHRVYKNFDPRSRIIKKVVTDVLNDLQAASKEPLLEIAVELEKIALTDPYFIEKKLYPNVDFYSGILMRAMGIPTSMFTVMFALGRTTGWISQWKEMIEYPAHKIARPRQVFTGQTGRKVIALKDRKEVLPKTNVPQDNKQSYGIH